MNSLAAIADASTIERGERPKKHVPDELVAAVSTALWQMKDAGLADFGQIKDPQSVAEKSVTYAEALMPVAGDPFAQRICPECVFAAADRICRTPAKKPGEQNPIPSSGDFRAACEESWHGIYRHASVPLIKDGCEVRVIVAVRRDATEQEVAAALDRARTRAMAGGCKALPASAPATMQIEETRARMRKVLGWEAPRA